MIGIILFIAIAVVILLALLFLAREKRERSDTVALMSFPEVQEWLPQHARYFSSVRQAISESDAAFLSRRARPESVRRARAERRRVVQEFLGGLREDFVHMERASRALTAISPKVSRQLEWESFKLGLQFRGLYRLVWLRLYTGMNCLEPLTQLTNVLANMASRVDAIAIGIGQMSAQAVDMGPAPQDRGV